MPLTYQFTPRTAFSPPYALPGVGETLGIGTNSAYDIKPAGITTNSDWSYALFNNFGGGAFVRDFSPGGAFGSVGGGGHAVPPNIGGAFFDFADATWKRKDPQGGAYRDTDYSQAETTGAPDFEITGSGGVPAPCHIYGTAVEIPTSLGGGAKGSVILVTRRSITPDSVSSSTAYAMSADTGVWSKIGSSGRVFANSWGVLDEPRSRIWLLTGDQNNPTYNNIAYLDLADNNTWKTTASYTPPSDNHAEGACWMHGGYVFRQGLSGTLFAYDPDSNTWNAIAVSGTMPSNAIAFAYYPPTGKFYWISDSAGGTLTRLSPPVDLLGGTWVVDTVSVSPGLPARTTDGGDTPVHYNNFFYVPSIDRLAWVPGGGQSVFLVNPAT